MVSRRGGGRRLFLILDHTRLGMRIRAGTRHAHRSRQHPRRRHPAALAYFDSDPFPADEPAPRRRGHAARPGARHDARPLRQRGPPPPRSHPGDPGRRRDLPGATPTRGRRSPPPRSPTNRGAPHPPAVADVAAPALQQHHAGRRAPGRVHDRGRQRQPAAHRRARRHRHHHLYDRLTALINSEASSSSTA